MEVLSLDSWNRFRTEGYSYLAIPPRPGKLNCSFMHFTSTQNCNSRSTDIAYQCGQERDEVKIPDKITWTFSFSLLVIQEYTRRQ